MSEMTIFSAPKPFSDPHINIIQRNAIQSWVGLGEGVEVLLMGDEEGMAEAAAEYGARHLPEVACNPKGVPLINAMFRLAEEASDSPLFTFVNADILLLPEIVGIAQGVAKQLDAFALLGQRWNLDVTELLDFGEGWPERLKGEVLRRGKMHPPGGSDYFVYPRGIWKATPDLVVGRAGWDNWMIYYAANQPWPAIDATKDITIVHQNHGYAHLPDSQPHYLHEETFVNMELGGGWGNMWMLLDTNKELIKGRIRKPRPRLIRFMRELEHFIYPGEKQGPRWALTRIVRQTRRKMIGE
ncbi:MAG: hypothetical protein PVF83_03165 [Anaerolineales bacterium]|jgi:hypothetical protein